VYDCIIHILYYILASQQIFEKSSNLV